MNNAKDNFQLSRKPPGMRGQIDARSDLMSHQRDLSSLNISIFTRMYEKAIPKQNVYFLSTSFFERRHEI